MSYQRQAPHPQHSNVQNPVSGNQGQGGGYPQRNQHQQHQPQQQQQQQLSRTTSVEENQNGLGQYNNNGRPIQFGAPQTSLPANVPQINQFGDQKVWMRAPHPQQPPSQQTYPQMFYMQQNPAQMQFRPAQIANQAPFYSSVYIHPRAMAPSPFMIPNGQYPNPHLHLPEGSTLSKIQSQTGQQLYSVEAGNFPPPMVNQSQQQIPQQFLIQPQFNNVAFQQSQGYYVPVVQQQSYEQQPMQPTYQQNIANGATPVQLRQPITNFAPAAATPPVATPAFVSPQPKVQRPKKKLEIVDPNTGEQVQLESGEDKLERPESVQQTSSRNSPSLPEPFEQPAAAGPSPRPIQKEKTREPSEEAQKFLNEVSRKALESSSVPTTESLPVTQSPPEIITEEHTWTSPLNPDAEPFKSPGGTLMDPNAKEFVPPTGRTPPLKMEPPRHSGDQQQRRLKNESDRLKEEMTPNSAEKVARIVQGSISFGNFDLETIHQQTAVTSSHEVIEPYTDRLTPEVPKTSLTFTPTPEPAKEEISTESKRPRETPERVKTPSNASQGQMPEATEASTKSQMERSRETTPTPKIAIQSATPNQTPIETTLPNGSLVTENVVEPVPMDEFQLLEEQVADEIKGLDDSIIAHMEGLSLTESISEGLAPPTSTGVDGLEMLTPEASNTPVITPVYNDLVASLEKFWTRGVFNPLTCAGEKKYSREFMDLAARLPESTKRNAYIDAHPELFSERRSSSGAKPPRMIVSSASTQFFQPGFFDQGNRSPIQYQQRPSQNRGYTSRGSLNQQKQMQQQQSRAKPGQMVINRPSLVQDVKLRTAENAWKPASKVETVTNDSEEVETQKLYKKVRGILNRITPQTFEELLGEYFALNINDETRLKGVIDIFFDKTVEEPNYCSMYGKFCHAVCQDQLEKGDKSLFRNFLLNKCQREFDREKNFEEQVVQRQAEIEAAETEEKKKQLSDTLNEMIAKEKRRTLGTIKFIGELYLHSLLTAKIMTYCITKLATANADEEMTECLCKLLTTIGKKLDSEPWKEEQKESFNIVKGCYSYLEKLSATDLSSRVKFMIKDLFELRENRWEPRNKDKNVGPVKLDDLHRSIQKEKLDEQVNLQLYEQNKKSQQSDNRGQRGGGQQRRQPGQQGGGGQFQDDHSGSRGSGGRPVGSRGGSDQMRSYQQQQKRGEVPGGEKIEQKELSKHLKTDSENIRLGPSGLGFGKPRGAKKPQEKPAAHATAIRNSYGVFAEGDAEPVSHESPQTSRESSRSRREESPSIRDSKNISLAASPVPTPSQLSRDNSRTGSPDRVPTIENLDKYATQLLEEFVVSNDLKEAMRLLFEQQNRLGEIVPFCLGYAVDKSGKHRDQLGKLLSFLIAESDALATGIMTHIASFVSTAIEIEMEVDSPKVWHFLGQILAQIFAGSDVEFELSHLVDALSTAGENTPKILLGLLEAVPPSSLAEFVGRCHSQRELAVHLQHQDIIDFLSQTNVQAVVIPSNEPCLEESIANLDDLMRIGAVGDRQKPDDIIAWLENVPLKHRSDPKFVSALVKHVCKSTVTYNESMSEYDMDTDTFEANCKVFIYLMQGKRELEIAALDSIGLFVQSRDYPKGLLLQIFDCLEVSNSIPVESFLEWHEATMRSNNFGVLMCSSETKQWHDQLKQRLNQPSNITTNTSVIGSAEGTELSGKRTQPQTDRSATS